MKVTRNADESKEQKDCERKMTTGEKRVQRCLAYTVSCRLSPSHLVTSRVWQRPVNRSIP